MIQSYVAILLKLILDSICVILGSVNVQLSPNIGNQPQFGGGPLRQGGERLSPGGGGPPTSSEDDLWRKSNRKQKESRCGKYTTKSSIHWFNL